MMLHVWAALCVSFLNLVCDLAVEKRVLCMCYSVGLICDLAVKNGGYLVDGWKTGCIGLGALLLISLVPFVRKLISIGLGRLLIWCPVTHN